MLQELQNKLFRTNGQGEEMLDNQGNDGYSDA
jgi:hypothetical protein